jgi:hypothetical protein
MIVNDERMGRQLDDRVLSPRDHRRDELSMDYLVLVMSQLPLRSCSAMRRERRAGGQRVATLVDMRLHVTRITRS